MVGRIVAELTTGAKDIVLNDFIKDPAIRQNAREWMQDNGRVTVTPTDRGMTAIDHYHAYYVS